VKGLLTREILETQLAFLERLNPLGGPYLALWTRHCCFHSNQGPRKEVETGCTTAIRRTVVVAVVAAVVEVATVEDAEKDYHFHNTCDSGSGANRWNRNLKILVMST
jgi:hypothetical protein